MATFTLPNTQTGGSQQIQANSLADAQAQAQSQGTWSPAAGTYGANSVGAYNPSAPVSSAAPSTTQPTVSGSQQLSAGINSLLGAIASGNKQAFDEAVREYNQNFGLQTDQFNESVRQFNQNFGVTQAGLTGTYQGAPTQQAIAQAANLAAQQAGITGYYNAPTVGAAAPGVGAGPLTRYQPGTVVRTSANQFGVVGANGIVQSGGDQGPNDAAIYQAIQTPGAIQTISDAEFAAAQQAASAAASQAAQGGGAQGTPTMALEAQWANLYGANAPPTAGQQTLANIAQQNQIAQNWANIYGYTPQFDANGQPIFQQGTGPGAGQTLAAQQQTYAQQLGAINAAAALQANPFRQQQVIGQLGRVLGGQGVAGFSAPNTVQGVGTQGGTGPNTGMAYMSQLISDIQNPGANQASVQSVLDGIPTPNKINSADFLRSAPSTQQMILDGMNEKYGISNQDALSQIRNTLPAFQAPSTFGQVKG